jgi:hypothetical protein
LRFPFIAVAHANGCAVFLDTSAADTASVAGNLRFI